ncbi:MAG: MarR family transcriptional regulator [Gordonia sp. (in: high G+C Gram-positive bacteria)]
MDQVEGLFGSLSKYVSLRERALSGAHRFVASNGETAACRALFGLRHGPMRSRDLADVIVSDPSTVSRHVAQLVGDGLVRREADPGDGRASLLVLTDAGRRRVDEMFQARREMIVRLVDDWSDDEFTTFVSQLSRFVDAAESAYLTQQSKGAE